MQELDIEKFDPTAAALTEMVEKSRAVGEVDVSDKKQVAIVHENRMALKKARVQITAKGKELREDAIAFSKKVIEKERELIAIIEPEEIRLKEIEEEAERVAEMKKREAKLPARRARLDALGDGVEISDEKLLELDDAWFENYFTSREVAHAKAIADARQREQDERQRILDEQEAKAKADQEARQRELDEKERAINAERDRIDREKREAEEAERAKAEEERRAKERAEELKAAEERAAQAERERIAEEIKQKAVAEAAERAAMEKEKKYKAFLAEIGWTKKNEHEFIIRRVVVQETQTEKLEAFKKIGEYVIG